MRRAVAISLLAAVLACAACDSYGAGDSTTTRKPADRFTPLTSGIPAPGDGQKVTAAWANSVIVNEQKCADGSVLRWTSTEYWISGDLVFHARPDTDLMKGPAEALRTCRLGR